MQRSITAWIGLVAVVAAVGVVMRSRRGPTRTSPATTSRISTTAREGNDALLFALGDAAVLENDDGALLRSDLPQRDLPPPGAGSLPNGGMPVPPLPLSAPRQVRFGIVLVSFNGAQATPGERPPTRSIADAKAYADRLMTTATNDFHSAVQQGDPGSTEDIGRVRLGVLEPAPEYVLFTLPVGGVGGPVETPRGFWIVKRLE
ncbi:MAG: peptidylprolyl isomerase [Myxococcota bacterium]|nr:peptidylprolyl isomerase [Myxococcota bacterium]